VRHLALLVALIAQPLPAASDAANGQAAVLLSQTAGQWQGELQYRDYQSNTWQGLPMAVTIVAQPDGVTTVRTARFDDGPKTGTVTITTVALVDSTAATVAYASFRRGRPTDTGVTKIAGVTAGADAAHWTIVTTEQRIDGNMLAQVRETTTRAGDTMTTLKEVNPLDDKQDVWLARNRSVLRRIGS
jgi:hypothetical protein